MLVLSRKVNQGVIIRDRDGVFVCRVVLLDIQSTERGRIGFDAPRGVSIVRDELDLGNDEEKGGETCSR